MTWLRSSTTFHDSAAILRLLCNKRVALDVRTTTTLADFDPDFMWSVVRDTTGVITPLLPSEYYLWNFRVALQDIRPALSGLARVPQEAVWVLSWLFSTLWIRLSSKESNRSCRKSKVGSNQTIRKSTNTCFSS